PSPPTAERPGTPTGSANCRASSTGKQPVRAGEVAHQHQLHRDIVTCRRQTEADAGFHRDGIAGVVRDGPDLVELLAARQKAAQFAEIVILLRRYGPFAVDLVVQSLRRHELQPIEALVGIVDDGIEGEAEAVAEAPAHD